MKTTQLRIFLLAIALGAALPCLAQTPEPFEVRRAEAAFEELPVLNASEVLRPDILTGPHHKVREPVPTYFGANQCAIIQHSRDAGVSVKVSNEGSVTCKKQQIASGFARHLSPMSKRFQMVDFKGSTQEKRHFHFSRFG